MSDLRNLLICLLFVCFFVSAIQWHYFELAGDIYLTVVGKQGYPLQSGKRTLITDTL